MTRIILASGSFIRRKVLHDAGLAFEVCPAHVDEVLPQNGAPEDVAAALALCKANEVLARRPGCLVIGVDQVMWLDGELVGKAHSRAQARARLRSMSGRWHRFAPAAALVGADVEELTAQIVDVRFHSLSDGEIEAYLNTEEWQGSAGCYQIENRGAALVRRVDGDLHAVLGTPFFPLLRLLREQGVRPLAPERPAE